MGEFLPPHEHRGGNRPLESPDDSEQVVQLGPLAALDAELARTERGYRASVAEHERLMRQHKVGRMISAPRAIKAQGMYNFKALSELGYGAVVAFVAFVLTAFIGSESVTDWRPWLIATLVGGARVAAAVVRNALTPNQGG